jgi:hypothetical protein
MAAVVAESPLSQAINRGNIAQASALRTFDCVGDDCLGWFQGIGDRGADGTDVGKHILILMFDYERVVFSAGISEVNTWQKSRVTMCVPAATVWTFCFRLRLWFDYSPHHHPPRLQHLSHFRAGQDYALHDYLFSINSAGVGMSFGLLCVSAN